MKKVLFASALLALAASCTENELDSLSAPKQDNGISFVAEQAPMTRMQWDETETAYVPFWYAEQDRIGIFAVNVKKGAFGSETALNTGKDWTALQGGGTGNDEANAVYKATQSQQKGAFTSVEDASTLHFDGNKDARFLAVYPSTIKAAYDKGKITLSNLPAIDAQTQTTTKGYNEAITMYSLSIASKENSYDAVGEKVNLSFKRPLSALVMKTANANEYTKKDEAGNSIFGALKTVTVTAKGWNAPEGITADPIAASKLAYDNSTATIVIDTVADYKAEFEKGAGTGESETITLTIGGANGLDWNDDALAIAAIKNVDRSKTFSSAKKETVEVKFSFDKIDLVKTMETGNSWNNQFIEVPAIDIEEYPYLVTKGTSGNNRTLIVNSGAFSGIFNKAGKIAWTEGEDASAITEVELNKIETIISNVELTASELGEIKKFTALKNLTLAENTSIPANTFSTAQASRMLKLDLPKVTTVNKKFVNNSESVTEFAALTTLKMPAYPFEDENINKSLLNPGASGNTVLAVLDMSGVTSMMPIYGILRTMTFTNYTALTEVTVKDGVIVAPKGFKGCKALKTVNGKLDISKASEAFAMDDETTNANTTLTTVEINGTVIPDGAFTNCTKLATVKYNGNSVAPTAIGESAFAATDVQYMDLSNAKTIGEAAFSDCTKLAKTSQNAQDLVVGAEKIAANVFNGCTSLVIVRFTNATEIVGGDVFAGATKLQQVKFDKVFKLADDATATADLYKNVFTATPGNIDFWVNAAQPGVSSSKLTLSYKSGTGSSATTKIVEYGFKSIQ